MRPKQWELGWDGMFRYSLAAPQSLMKEFQVVTQTSVKILLHSVRADTLTYKPLKINLVLFWYELLVTTAHFRC